MTDIRHTVGTLSNHLFLGGRFVPATGSTVYDVINPAPEDVFASVAEATDAEIAQAITTANKAQKG